MKTSIFNSTMKCQGCVDKVKTYLDSEPAITEWDVNLANPNRPLKVTFQDSLTDDRIIAEVAKLGYTLTKVG